jgi:tRNA 2-selenouridine synthase
MRIQKRLGGLDTKNAVNFLLENDILDCFRILLTYYDKQYIQSMGNSKRTPIQMESMQVEPKENAKLILKALHYTKAV